MTNSIVGIRAHTPGPWRVVIDDDGNPLSGRPSVVAADEYDCAIVHWDGFAQTYWRSARGDKEIHANARLIAAAPDLLDALRKLTQQCRAEFTVDGKWVAEGQLVTQAAVKAAQAALAKAVSP